MKVTVLLKNDHQALIALFNKLNKPSGTLTPNAKMELCSQIRRDMSIHSQIEKEIFYPAVTAISSPRAAELVLRAQKDHDSIEKLLQELSTTNASDKTFETRTMTLMEEVLRHIEMEEEQIFEEVRTNLPEYRLEELGLEMEDRRKVLLTLAA
jgi:hemerythrin superfamily protein